MGITPQSRPKTGIIAGWGRFPIEVAEELRRQGHELFIVCLKGHASSELENLATDHRWLGVAKMGAQFRYLKRCAVQQVAFAGKIFKDKVLHHGNRHLSNLPDLTCYRVVWQSLITRSKDARDDTLLMAVVDFYNQRGIEVLPIQRVAPNLLAEDGFLSRRKPNRRENIDISFGWQTAKQMGALDVGQSITVKDQMVLGVEAIEGTDALIQRTAALCPRGGFTLIKLAKPEQDMRFDVPTIGVRTVEQLARAGGKVIAIEANKTLIVERQATLKAAQRHGIAIVSMNSEKASCLNGSSSSNASIPNEPDMRTRAA